MVGYALSGFVDGFFRGREMKNSWEDRKLDRERQTRLDKMAEERHGAIMAQYGREAADWDRANRMLETELGVLDRAADAASAGVQTTAGAAADARNDRASTKSPSMSLGAVPEVPVSGGGGRFAAMMDRTSPAGELAARAEAQAETSARRAPDATPGPVVAGHNMPGSTRMDPRDVGASMLRNGNPESVAAMAMPPGNQGMGVAPQVAPGAGPMRRLPDGTIVAPAPSAAIADELYQQGPVGARYIPPDRQMGAVLQENAAPATAPTASADGQTRNVYVPGRGMVAVTEPTREDIAALTEAARSRTMEDWANITAPVRDAARSAHGLSALGPYGMGALSVPPQHRSESAGGDMGARGTSTAQAAPQLDPANPVPPMRAAVPPDATSEEARAVAGAVAAINETVPAPSADAARTAAASLGVDPGDKVTPAQYERASQSFMDRYLEVGAPMVIEHYLRTGQTEKAQKFMEFVDTAQNRQNMKDWGVAAAALAVGNVDKAANTIIGAMERMDYFDEGTELVRDKSGVMRDKDGNATGVKLVFKDTKSGTTFEQVYDNMEDAIALGMSLMDPMTAFEQMQERAAAQRETALGLQEEALKARSEAAEWVGKRYSEILEASKQLDGTFAKTSEQAMREAMDAYRLLQRGLSGEDEEPTAPVDPSRDPNTNYRE